MIEKSLEALLGSPVVERRPMLGGDIHEAFAVRLADGREAFVKTSPDAPADMFRKEALGLEFLRRTGAIRIPAVLGISERTVRRLLSRFDERVARLEVKS